MSQQVSVLAPESDSLANAPYKRLLFAQTGRTPRVKGLISSMFAPASVVVMVTFMCTAVQVSLVTCVYVRT